MKAKLYIANRAEFAACVIEPKALSVLAVYDDGSVTATSLSGVIWSTRTGIHAGEFLVQTSDMIGDREASVYLI